MLTRGYEVVFNLFKMCFCEYNLKSTLYEEFGLWCNLLNNYSIFNNSSWNKNKKWWKAELKGLGNLFIRSFVQIKWIGFGKTLFKLIYQNTFGNPFSPPTPSYLIPSVSFTLNRLKKLYKAIAGSPSFVRKPHKR